MKLSHHNLIILLLVCNLIFLSNSLWPYAEEYVRLESDISRLEITFKDLISQQEKINNEINELAQKISALKKKENLNIFQRRRLEGYLKSSQKLTLQIENVHASILSLKSELLAKRKELINLYDVKLKEIITQLDETKLDESRKNELFANLALTKQKRETLQAKIDLEIHEPMDIADISQENAYNTHDFKEKADWLKDQEDKLRNNVIEIDDIIENLNEEIEIREKMSELEQDISLFSHRDEPKDPGKILTANEVTFERIFEIDISNNAYLENALNSRSSLLPIFPNLTLEKDVSKFNKLDIQNFIRELEKRKKQLLVTADSLQIKADEYYRKAEQAKKIERQD